MRRAVDLPPHTTAGFAFPRPAPRPKKEATGLRRAGPLKRKARISPRRAAPTRAQLARKDGAFWGFVATLKCAARHLSPCRGRLDNHHTGGTADGKGTGIKASDRTVIRLCRGHHDAIRNPSISGPFHGWSRDRRRAWEAFVLAETLRAYEGRPS